MVDFQKYIDAGADEKYSNDTEGEIPAGVYTCQLQNAEIREKDDGSAFFIIWEHLIRGGEYEGETVNDFSHPIHDKPFPRKMYKDRIRALGFEPTESISDIEELVAAIREAAPMYRAKIFTKNGFQNVQIQSLLESQEAPAVSKAAPKTTPVASEPEETESAVLAVGDTVEFEGESGPLTGTVDAFTADGEVSVEASDGQRYVADPEAFTVVEAAEDDADETLRIGLIETAQANAEVVGDVSDDMELADLKVLLSQFDWTEDELTPDEIVRFKEADITVGVKSKPKAAKPKAKPKAKAKTKEAKAKKR